jgi:hypothetical protein
MKLNRILYFGYYLKQLDREKFSRFLNYVHHETGKSRIALLKEIMSSVFLYNISLLEYFQFGFYDDNKNERKNWAGTGFMYEYQRLMNPPSSRRILDDKREFYKAYKEFFVHKLLTLDAAKASPELLDEFLHHDTGKLVLKDATGKCGSGVAVVSNRDFDRQSLLNHMHRHRFDLIEEFLVQHPAFQELAPTAVNTVRIFTQVNARNEVELLGCRLRIAVDGPVDNMAAGNMAAPIEESTGIINGAAVFSDITRKPCETHPVTGVRILGFQIPFWQEILTMVKRAALKHPQNRSIGWDVVVTENGPGLIEGNHDWCKLVWQLPVNQGLKSILIKHQQELAKR